MFWNYKKVNKNRPKVMGGDFEAIIPTVTGVRRKLLMQLP